MNKENQLFKNQGKWTKDEKTLFDLAYRWHGKDWKKLCEAVGTRNVKQIRNRARKVEKMKQGEAVDSQRVFVIPEALKELMDYITKNCISSIKTMLECQQKSLQECVNRSLRNKSSLSLWKNAEGLSHN